jgi:hypothetical protein
LLCYAFLSLSFLNFAFSSLRPSVLAGNFRIRQSLRTNKKGAGLPRPKQSSVLILLLSADRHFAYKERRSGGRAEFEVEVVTDGLHVAEHLHDVASDGDLLDGIG